MDIKSMINEEIIKKNFSKAKELTEHFSDPVQRYNALGIIHFYEGNLDLAKSMFEDALKINPIDSDVLFNYSKVLFEKGEYFKSWRYLTRITDKNWEVWDMLGDTQLKLNNPAMAVYYYKKAYESSKLPELKEKYELIRKKYYKGKRIVFLCKEILDSFLGDIIDVLSNIYDTKLVKSDDLNDKIIQAYDWAEIVWIEFANELSIDITNKLSKKNKKIVCRLHSYEALNYFPQYIGWSNVDKLILVSKHIQTILQTFHKNVYPKINDIQIVPNGVNLNKFKFKNRQHGYDIAIVANIDYKKDPAAWMQVI
ncbi:MAG: glycosyl transferase family A, partial [Fervidobacterium sp.]